jgi:hypothetical protein
MSVRLLSSNLLSLIAVVASFFVAPMVMSCTPVSQPANAAQDCSKPLPPRDRAACRARDFNARKDDPGFRNDEATLLREAEENYKNKKYTKAWRRFSDAAVVLPTAYSSIMAGNARFMSAAQPPLPTDIDGNPVKNNCYKGADFVQMVEIEVPQTYRVGIELANISQGGRPVSAQMLASAKSRAACLERLAMKIKAENEQCVDRNSIRACIGSDTQ